MWLIRWIWLSGSGGGGERSIVVVGKVVTYQGGKIRVKGDCISKIFFMVVCLYVFWSDKNIHSEGFLLDVLKKCEWERKSIDYRLEFVVAKKAPRKLVLYLSPLNILAKTTSKSLTWVTWQVTWKKATIFCHEYTVIRELFRDRQVWLQGDWMVGRRVRSDR